MYTATWIILEKKISVFSSNQRTQHWNPIDWLFLSLHQHKLLSHSFKAHFFKKGIILAGFMSAAWFASILSGLLKVLTFLLSENLPKRENVWRIGKPFSSFVVNNNLKGNWMDMWIGFAKQVIFPAIYIIAILCLDPNRNLFYFVKVGSKGS